MGCRDSVEVNGYNVFEEPSLVQDALHSLSKRMKGRLKA